MGGIMGERSSDTRFMKSMSLLKQRVLVRFYTD